MSEQKQERLNGRIRLIEKSSRWLAVRDGDPIERPVFEIYIADLRDEKGTRHGGDLILTPLSPQAAEPLLDARIGAVVEILGEPYEHWNGKFYINGISEVRLLWNPEATPLALTQERQTKCG